MAAAYQLDSIETNLSPAITIVAACYNEEATCGVSTRSFLALDYPDYEVLIVNDGSKDKTLEILIEAYDLVPTPRQATSDLPSEEIRCVYQSRYQKNLWVIDKANGGKACALNAGINHCRTPLFCCVDADTLLETHALTQVVRPFLEDSSTVASGGIIRIVNGCDVSSGVVSEVRMPKGFLPQIQVVEYLRAFLAGRAGFDAMDATMVISGAFGVFDWQTVVDCGGYDRKTVGEDMELIVRLHRYCMDIGRRHKIRFMPDPVAWTEAPEDLKLLSRQRRRWQRGLTEVLLRHRGMLLRRKYGAVGMAAFPYFMFLEMGGPVIEALGYIAFPLTVLILDPSLTYVLAFIGLSSAFGLGLSISAIAMEELSFRRYKRWQDFLLMFWLVIVENFGYRQLNSYWRIRGLIDHLVGTKSWGEMPRKGFGGKNEIPWDPPGIDGPAIVRVGGHAGEA